MKILLKKSSYPHFSKTWPLFLLLTLLVIFLSCGDNRGLINEEGLRKGSGPSLSLVPSALTARAQLDTVFLFYQLTDANQLLITDAQQVKFSARYGVVDTNRSTDGPQGSYARYFYPKLSKDTLRDTIIAYMERGIGYDNVADTAIIRIDPLGEGTGFLPASNLHLQVRADSVFKAGAGWKMLVYAKVSDSLGNPVRNDLPVNFAFLPSGIDTSLVSFINVARTGRQRCIQNFCDSLPGEAVSILTFASRAISQTVSLSAWIEGAQRIQDQQSLILPLPKAGLRLSAHYRNAGDLIVRNFQNDTARIVVSLSDAYNQPIPNKRVCVTPRGGLGVPNCSVKNAEGAIIGSTPCRCQDGPEYCDMLPNPYCGWTDAKGTFPASIYVTKIFQLDPEVLKQTVQVELEEQETQVRTLDFSFDVIFP